MSRRVSGQLCAGSVACGVNVPRQRAEGSDGGAESSEVAFGEGAQRGDDVLVHERLDRFDPARRLGRQMQVRDPLVGEILRTFEQTLPDQPGDHRTQVVGPDEQHVGGLAHGHPVALADEPQQREVPLGRLGVCEVLGEASLESPVQQPAGRP